MDTNNDFLTIKQASELTNKSPITIRRLIKQMLTQNNPEVIQLIKQEQGRGGFIYKVKENLIRQKYNLPNQMDTQKENLPNQKDSQDRSLPTQKNKDDKANQKQEPEQSNKTDTNTKLLGAKTEIINILKGELYKKDHQMKTKDWQIGSLGKKIDNLIERGRETNIILKGLQDRVFMLEAPRNPGPKNENENKLKVKKRGAFSKFLNKKIF